MDHSMDSDLPLDALSAPASSREDVMMSLRERLVAFAASRHGRSSAEDLVQEVFVVLEEKYAHLSRVEDLMPLCFQILRFKLAGLQRKEWRRGEADHAQVDELPLASDAPDPETQAMRSQMLARLLEGIQQMGPKCRDLFRFKLQGKGFQDIQGLMGAETLNTVYTWDHRCRKQLLAYLGGRWMP
jgi:RNA polymerase sigma-70 factor (ECF subfamily)